MAAMDSVMPEFRDHTWIPRYEGRGVEAIREGVLLSDTRAESPLHLRVVKCLGEGDFGQVWLAQDALNRSYALKHFVPNPLDPIPLFDNALKEKRVLDHLGADHPHVPILLTVGQVGLNPVLCLEAVDREPLSRQSFPVSLERLREVALVVITALAAAHRKGIVHGDIKLDNVIVSTSQARGLLLDWGLAFRAPGRVDADPASLEFRRRSLYVPWHRPPEVIVGAHYGPEGDLWALGVMLYLLLVDKYPWPLVREEVLPLAILHETKRCWGTERVTQEDIDVDPEMARNTYDAGGLKRLAHMPPFKPMPEVLRETLQGLRESDAKIGHCMDFFFNLFLHWKRRIRAEEALCHPFLLGAIKVQLAIPPDWMGGRVYIKTAPHRVIILDHGGRTVTFSWLGALPTRVRLCDCEERIVAEEDAVAVCPEEGEGEGAGGGGASFGIERRKRVGPKP